MHSASAIIKGKYLDSVKLMLISKQMRLQSGVTDAVAIMATPENLAILQATGMNLRGFDAADPVDICIGVIAESDVIASRVVDLAEEWIVTGIPGDSDRALKESATANKVRNIDSALKIMPEANLALISVAGKYAVREARRALLKGLHVMLFSDNVGIEEEKELKELALSRGLLMMGADCGTAIINGVPLAFANQVRRGNIGIVSAAGTGLQEVACIIHNKGCGISQAFGTGGRDGKKAIGGLMLMACLQYLISDEGTKVIVLISKVPDPEIIDKIWEVSATTNKPVVVNLLVPFNPPAPANVHPAPTLTQAAVLACRLASGDQSSWGSWSGLSNDIYPNRKLITLPQEPKRIHLRALYSGGTLCYEAQVIYHQKMGDYAWSNAPLEPSCRVGGLAETEGDVILDLGGDEFTVGRLHPMIDYALRVKAIEDIAKREDIGIILLDVVLGFGSHPAPQEELAPVISKVVAGHGIVVICTVVGTDADPQNRPEVIATLKASGAIVTDSNAEACEIALSVLNTLRRS
ncbi:MAG: acyl-CoA synthetase FdrA [Candidatus Cloacimonetes bacterium]|nr:acyl-CoA synthetase FdrA [Candidatus Cloacimonadota bacterium]